MKKCRVFRPFRDMETGAIYAAGIEADLSDDLIKRVQTTLGMNVLKIMAEAQETTPAKKPRSKKAKAEK